MWVIALFDLPTETKENKRAYRQFREKLMNDGFWMMQFSVYVRFCSNLENAQVHAARVEDIVPDEGQVRVITLTSLQFARMKIFLGKCHEPTEEPPAQLSFW